MARTTKKVTRTRGRAKNVVEARTEKKQSFFDNFRFGESYTSLILGIVVVIITAVLLVSFVRNRNISDIQNTKPEIASNRTQVVNEATTSATTSPTTVVSPTVTRTVTATPTRVPTRALTVTPTPTKSEPTTKPTNTKAPTVTVARPTVTKAASTQQPDRQTAGKRTYTVAQGDNLWKIAEKLYRSGYNWVDIARANNISNPGTLYVGTKLIVPDVTPKVATVQKEQPTVTSGPKITGTTYKVVKGDSLWDIAVRAYGDGYRWTEIARVNKVFNPNIIYPGTTLKLERNNSPNIPQPIK